jgi:hypothetical protein
VAALETWVRPHSAVLTSKSFQKLSCINIQTNLRLSSITVSPAQVALKDPDKTPVRIISTVSSLQNIYEIRFDPA